jgi:hypothetical protein
MADSWSTKLAQSWLASPGACLAMDAKLAQLMAVHWGRRGAGATAQLLLPMRCETTAASLIELGKQPDAAMSCTLLLVMLGELLLCAEHGGILRDDVMVERFAGGIVERWLAAEALRRLRNAACHPAAVVTSVKGDVGIVSFANFLITNFKRESWARGLRTQPGLLANRAVSLFALRMVNSIGWWQADHWDVRFAGLKPPGNPRAVS